MSAEKNNTRTDHPAYNWQQNGEYGNQRYRRPESGGTANADDQQVRCANHGHPPVRFERFVFPEFFGFLASGDTRRITILKYGIVPTVAIVAEQLTFAGRFSRQ